MIDRSETGFAFNSSLIYNLKCSSSYFASTSVTRNQECSESTASSVWWTTARGNISKTLRFVTMDGDVVVKGIRRWRSSVCKQRNTKLEHRLVGCPWFLLLADEMYL